MISANFYPTESTLYNEIELTDHLLDIPGFTDTMADAYLMGYIPADKMPAAFMPNYLTAGVGSMSSIYHPKNTGWGYGWLDLNAEYRYATSFTRVNGSIVARPDMENRIQYRLFNAIKMARANTGMQISITCIFAHIDDAVYDGDGGTIGFVHGGTDAGSWGSPSSQTFTYTFDQFANIIENDLPLFSVTRTGNAGAVSGKTFTFAPRPSEFGDSNDPNADHKWIVDSGLGAQAVIMIDAYEINSSMTYANGNGGGTTYYLRPFTYPDIDAVGDFPATKAMLFPATLSNTSQRLTWSYDKNTRIFQLVPGNTQTYTIADYNINPGGFNFGTITDRDADFENTTQYTRELLVKKSIWMNANRFGTVTGGVIQNIYTPMDVYRHALLYHKHTTNGFQTGYGDSDTWTTRFDASDAPTGEILTGSYSSIVSSLRPWQLPDVDISTNEFTPEDVPPEPGPEPGPTPQETESKFSGYPTLGYSTRIIPTPGVNFYALNASLTSTFVERLWSQPKNFYEAIQIAGNQVDSIFDYIQSFRFYPLSFDFSTSNIYPVIFGTGAVLKEADGDTNFQLSEATQVQHTVTAGVWNLSDPIYHWRNNFLDYSPYLKMSIYIPFAGTIELSPEAVASHTDISAATITLYASFDIETGTITYYVANQANVLLAQKTVKIAIDLPLSGNNSAEQSAAILRAQFSTVKQLLGAGTSAVMGAATGNMAGVASAAVSTLGSVGDMYLQNSLAQRAVPVEIQGMGGTFSALAGGQYPYITINRQKVSNPPNYAHTTGYLVEGTYKISNLNGLTVCRNVDISGVSQATDKEKAQIKQILESGFYA